MLTVALADEIREMIRDATMPDMEIAEKVGIHPVTLSRFKSGNHSLKIETIERIAELLGYQIVVKPAKGKLQKR